MALATASPARSGSRLAGLLARTIRWGALWALINKHAKKEKTRFDAFVEMKVNFESTTFSEASYLDEYY